jgi:nucleotide-binding universal stress UspA family protein
MKKVLLTLDGSECSKAAIPVTKELAASLHADVVLVTVGNLPESGNMAREEKVELLGMLNRIVREFGLQADTRVDMSGDAAEGILKVADDENVDLIVMATHGRSGLSEFTQGSVAREVVRDGRKPVVLVRPRNGARGK